MQHPSHEAPLPDFTTPEGLRALLELLVTEQLWRTHPSVRGLMEYAEQKYQPLALTWHRDPADAAYEAFMAMRTPAVLRARDPWAAITRAVELGIAAEVHAERLLTSTDKARRPEHRPDEYPVRAGHYETFFYHVLAAATPPVSPTVAVERVVRSASVFLVTTGWHPRTIEAAVEYICHRLTSLASTQSGIDVLRKDQAMRQRLGFSTRDWNGLLRLLLGPRSKKTVTGTDPARLGIFARILLGDRTEDLLADRALTAASRKYTQGGEAA